MSKTKTDPSRGRPLVALSCSSLWGLPWGEYSAGHRYDYFPDGYARCVELAGGLPAGLLLTEDEAVLSGLLDRVDGLILTGGPDVAPRRYGQEPRPGLGEVNEPLDAFELASTRLAVAKGLPVLGICRGVQLLAVAFGGDLIQDLPREVQGCLDHAQKLDKAAVHHRVAVEAGTRLAAIVGQETLWVNSKHHQAIKTPPPGFIVSARAGDGVIEALERPGQALVLGVQWHPEGLGHWDQPSLALFQALVESAAERGRSRPTGRAR
jgi:putative glutamine amidotransferase